ncbi:MAG: M23 family metallopeptidase [Deltaproteobacteria bacterium]|nr:M23 family metallopeptidase [Deltaproteobacteria bacterium]
MERMNRQRPVLANRSGLAGAFYLALLLLSIFAALSLMSCAGSPVKKGPAKGVYHIVKKGETAYSIARAYAVDLQDLAEANNITDAANIKEGSVIFIPGANQVIDDVLVAAGKAGEAKPRDADGATSADTRPQAAGKPAGKAPVRKTGRSAEQPGDPGGEASKMPAAPPPGGEDKTAARQRAPVPENEVRTEKGSFAWPVKGTVKTRFGIQPNKTYHNWIKIVCPAGAKVKASAGGTVIFSAGLKDFGETIIIRHANDFATVYTHLKKRYAQADQNVKKGEPIALAGETDEAGDAYLNFEIRLKGKARNPLFYLP